MEGCRLWGVSILVAAVSGVASPMQASAIELGELVAIHGAARGIVQHGRYKNATNEEDQELDQETRGAAIVDLDIDFHPTPLDTFWARLRFAGGNALNDVGGIELPPYNGPLEDDVKDINGSGRNYLLEAWYRHTLEFTDGGHLAATGGIIDSTRYIDENRYANDEDTQFMNPAFATPDNRPGAPSYDPGVALELHGGLWSLKGVYMKGSNESIDDFDYFAVQAGYHHSAATVPGNYRILAYRAAGRLKKPRGQSDNARMHGLGASIDQALGDGWGIFFRAFIQNDKEPVVYDRDVSGGISINGRHWGRPDDVLGIAYAYLTGSDQAKIDHSHVAEVYLKFHFLRDVDVTFDVQYQTDRIDSPRGNPQAWIVGGRLNFDF
ncbi:MAG: carbohydrate porin [Pseudomonadota bacterium]|nr:carbohydrate porin [Pseudomonadota bacterium]